MDERSRGVGGRRWLLCVGRGGGRASLAMQGAIAVADALAKHDGNFEAVFQEYPQALRPFMEEGQATDFAMLSNYLVPSTEAAIRTRNAHGIPF